MDPLSDEELLCAVQPLIEMATECFEAQVEAARMFCDLSRNQCLHDMLADSGCVTALVSLALRGPELARMHAILALANLSSSHSCQEAMIVAGVLPVLVDLVVDGPYYTTGMRRESARLLANLTDRLAIHVIAALGTVVICRLIAVVDSLSDSTVKVHAQRAQASLQTALVS